MNAAVSREAEQFLDATYGFDAATRAQVIERAATEILRNCRELLAHLDGGEADQARHKAHRLKGNLKALGLAELARQAQTVEDLALHDPSRALAAAKALRLTLSATPSG